MIVEENECHHITEAFMADKLVRGVKHKFLEAMTMIDFLKTLYLSKFHFQNRKGNNNVKVPVGVISEHMIV